MSQMKVFLSIFGVTILVLAEVSRSAFCCLLGQHCSISLQSYLVDFCFAYPLKKNWALLVFSGFNKKCLILWHRIAFEENNFPTNGFTIICCLRITP